MEKMITQLCFDFPYDFSETFLTEAEFSEVVINVHRLYVKYSFFVSDFYWTLVFSTDFRKILVLNFMKIRPVGAEFFHAETDVTKLIVAFRSFSNAPKKGIGDSKFIWGVNILKTHDFQYK